MGDGSVGAFVCKFRLLLRFVEVEDVQSSVQDLTFIDEAPARAVFVSISNHDETVGPCRASSIHLGGKMLAFRGKGLEGLKVLQQLRLLTLEGSGCC